MTPLSFNYPTYRNIDLESEFKMLQAAVENPAWILLLQIQNLFFQFFNRFLSYQIFEFQAFDFLIIFQSQNELLTIPK